MFEGRHAGVLAVAFGVVSFAGLPAFAQDSRAFGEAAERAGEQVIGNNGITETVAEIMGREGRRPHGAVLAREKPKHTIPLRKRPNPAAPEVSAWPAPASEDPSEPPPLLRAPSPFTPQVVGTNFLGIQGCCGPGRLSNFVPPDSIGDVGPTQILVASNGRIRVFSRTGVLGALDADMDTFFQSVGGEVNGTTDPHVRYDRLSQRWFVVIIDISGCPNNILLAVSSGPTITGSSNFTFFSFPGQAGAFTDYPTLGVDRNALYIGANMFDVTSVGCPAPSSVNTTAFVVNKASLLAGALNVTAFRDLAAAGVGPWTPQGADNDDPAATEGYFVGTDFFVFSRMPVYRVNNPGGAPTLSGPFNINVPATTLPIDQPQPSGPLLDALDDRPFAAAVHRNRITGTATLWTAHNIEVNSSGVGTIGGGRNGSRWYEIGNLTTTPALLQAGTLFDSAGATPFGYWIPSVALSGQGHMAIGSSRASASAASGGFASVAVAGRLRTDAPGVTQAPTLAQGSGFSYDTFVDPVERWGDYSQTVVDPNDDQTLWTFQELAAVQPDTWGVQVVQLKAPPPATPVSATPASVLAGQSSVTVVITGASVAGSEFFDPGPDVGGPGFPNHIAASVSGGVTVNSVTFNSPTQVTLNISTLAASTGAKDVSIVNPDGQSRTATGLLTVTLPCASITLNPAIIPPGRLASAYSQAFSQAGGSPPVAFSLSGALPAGMSFNPGTATLSGTPTLAGTVSINVTARDANNCQRTRKYALVIASGFGTAPVRLVIDEGAGGNGVYEPGESGVLMAPTWLNISGGSLSLIGAAAGFTGPGAPSNPAYSVTDGSASYGVVPNLASASCVPAGNCYGLSMTTPSGRPVQHWDATCNEVLSSGPPIDSKNWTIHVGLSFPDVAVSHPFYGFVETIFHRGVTSGCTTTDYCPSGATLRAQMAVFLLRAKEGASYVPPAATGMFADVPPSEFYAPYVEELARRGVTTGCQLAPALYCPGNPVLRSQMAVFLLRALEGNAYAPPAATGMFGDVPPSGFFAPYIEELARRSITTGCQASPPLYCPNDPITRGQMAAFLTRTFSMTLYSQ